VTGEWRDLYNEEHNGLYPNQYCAGDKIENNVSGGVIKLRLVRGEACTGFWWENVRERDHGRDPGLDGRVIFRWICR
jgi:hypothetical protein